MSPIEHYFENLLTIGSDIKGEPNKNDLSKEVQEAIEICADYTKHSLFPTENLTVKRNLKTIKYIFQYVIAFLIGCIFCVFVEYLVRPQYDVNFEHKMMSHNGYNYCPYCGENLYDSENVVTVEIGEVEK